jgi:hypothetical protein
MKFIYILIVVIFLASTSHAATLKETVLITSAGGAICKIYAEEVGGDVEAFSDMNALIIKIAEKIGYLNDFQSYTADVSKAKSLLQNQLLQMHGSKLNVYNNWCIKFYNSTQNGLVKAYR